MFISLFITFKTILIDFKYQLEKRGYEDSEIKFILQENTAFNRSDLLYQPNLKIRKKQLRML